MACNTSVCQLCVISAFKRVKNKYPKWNQKLITKTASASQKNHRNLQEFENSQSNISVEPFIYFSWDSSLTPKRFIAQKLFLVCRPIWELMTIVHLSRNKTMPFIHRFSQIFAVFIKLRDINNWVP